ncbi:hypothetical protein [Leptospira saintgironsiae]|nr:hypothetical protein [Leptospira saintgironsiae]
MILNPNEINFVELTLTTRVPDHFIENNQVIDPVIAGKIELDRKYRQEFSTAIPRSNPCNYYNCHGLTFASRRTRVINSNEIQIILEDDSYKQIENIRNVMPGDIVVYYQEGDAQHSAIVINVDLTTVLTQVKVVSKWGEGSEFIHLINDCPYARDSDEIKYYRVHSVEHE